MPLIVRVKFADNYHKRNIAPRIRLRRSIEKAGIMSGFDIVLVFVILAAGVIEAIRGFGRAVFDCIGLYLALLGANLVYPPLAGSVHFHVGAADNQACAYGIALFVFGIAMLFVSRFVYGTVLYSAGVFDQLLGVAAGLVLGLMIAHGVTRAISLTDPSGQGRVASYTDTAFSDEILNFTSYHRLMADITNFGQDERSDPYNG